MIQYADKDGDGRISYQEFVEIVVKEYPTVWFDLFAFDDDW